MNATRNSSSVTLTWSASPDSIVGYHVYRSGSVGGPFTRLTGNLVTGTSYTDTASPVYTSTYMVRAIKLENAPSGTYFNPSQGIFVTSQGAPPISLTCRRTNNNMVITWNSQSGTAYRVFANSSFSPQTWSNISGSITANSTTTSWTASNINTLPFRVFRVGSP